MTNSKNPNTCSIVKSASSKSWAEPRQLLDKFVHVSERSLNVRFKMLAGDFVLDRNQKWWFLQVKAFELRDKIHQPVVAPPLDGKAENQDDYPDEDANEENTLEHDYEELQQLKTNKKIASRCGGEYCHELLRDEDKILYPNEGMLHEIAYKDVLITRQVQELLEQNNHNFIRMRAASSSTSAINAMLGVNIFSLEQVMMSKISMRDRNRLYDGVSVCRSCHYRYSFNRKLIEEAKLAEEGAKKIRAKEKKTEKELTNRAVVDSRIKGGRGAVSLGKIRYSRHYTVSPCQ